MSGGFNPLSVVNPAALLGTALGGPLGGIITQAIQQVVSTVVQEVIQKAGDMLNVPQPLIDSAQGAFASSVGDYQGAAQNLQEAVGGLSDVLNYQGADAGNFQREIGDQLRDAITEQARQIAQTASEEGNEALGNGSARGGAGVRGGSVLMKIAMAIGEALDKKVDRQAAIADEMGAMGEIDGKNMSQYNQLSAEMTALSQEIKIVSEALNNALKSIGDSSSKLASRQ